MLVFLQFLSIFAVGSGWVLCVCIVDVDEHFIRDVHFVRKHDTEKSIHFEHTEHGERMHFQNKF